MIVNHSRESEMKKIKLGVAAVALMANGRRVLCVLDKYEDECVHASKRELVAADAERTSVKYKLVEFMQDKVGQEFDGTVSGMTEWGMYVEIDPTRIEGMISLREIRSDFYDFDEVHYRLVGRRTGKVFHLGRRIFNSHAARTHWHIHRRIFHKSMGTGHRKKQWIREKPVFCNLF